MIPTLTLLERWLTWVDRPSTDTSVNHRELEVTADVMGHGEHYGQVVHYVTLRQIGEDGPEGAHGHTLVWMGESADGFEAAVLDALTGCTSISALS